MNERRFINPTQPQTLYMAVILCYVNAVFNLINTPPLLILVGFVLAASGYGIANEKKWGYTAAVVASLAQVVLLLAYVQSAAFTQVGPLLDFIFYVALVALLLHPMSRDYQRIWFR